MYRCDFKCKVNNNRCTGCPRKKRTFRMLQSVLGTKTAERTHVRILRFLSLWPLRVFDPRTLWQCVFSWTPCMYNIYIFYLFFFFSSLPLWFNHDQSRGEEGQGSSSIEWARARSDLRPGHLSRGAPATIHLFFFLLHPLFFLDFPILKTKLGT